jgi:HK97 family phage major capsid protein
MTIAELRRKYGDALSDAALRAAAQADGIEVTEDGPADNATALREMSEMLRGYQERQRLDETTEDEDEQVEHLRGVLGNLFKAELSTPSREERTPEVSPISDIFDHLNYDGSATDSSLTQEQRAANIRANLELAGMIFGGTQDPGVRAPAIEMPEYFKRAWQHHVFETGATPYVVNHEGNPSRAMDTAETGFGLELMGTQYTRELWAGARNMDGLVGRIREIPVTDNSGVVPIDGDLPEMLFVSESTDASATAYTTSKTGSGQVTLSPKKFTIQQIWSGELNEDSIIAYTPFLRERLTMSASLYLGSSYLNGDTTNAGTGNINSDDADPTDTKHYLAYDGIRHYWLVDATGQGKSMAATLDPVEILRARGKLNAGDDDVDALIKNINWGRSARELLLVMDWDTHMNMVELDVVKTIDQYGSQAAVVTGELGAYSGMPIISPSYASKTEADGKASGTEASNTLGQISLLNPAGFLAGRRRETQLFFDRIQRTDQFLFELYTRRAFTRFGGNVAAGIYNITVA